MSEAPSTAPGFRLGMILALTAAVGFASKAIFVKLAYRYPVDAITLLTLRLVLALPMFWLIKLARRDDGPPLAWRDRLWLILLGLLGYYLSSLFDFLGLVTVSASLERLILFLYPTFTVLFSAWFAKTPITRRVGGALVLSYLGMLLVLVPDLRNAHAAWSGILLVFLSTVSYALYLTWSPAVIARIGAMRFTEGALTISAVAMVTHFLVTHPVSALAVPTPVWIYAAVIALIATVFPIYAMAAAMARIGAPRAAIIGSIGPILTIFLGMLVLDERLTPLQWLGAAVVMAGVLRVSKKK
ncbi:DMT family transporter [Silvimonas soli]|uniref:DMT family transporter n=1 Tax=Silvimonas soli TaxID=2980100 RepID=UPI0024B3B5BD|nr:DMT family transporter [Silvimonas soli]